MSESEWSAVLTERQAFRTVLNKGRKRAFLCSRAAPVHKGQGAVAPAAPVVQAPLCASNANVSYKHHLVVNFTQKRHRSSIHAKYLYILVVILLASAESFVQPTRIENLYSIKVTQNLGLSYPGRNRVIYYLTGSPYSGVLALIWVNALAEATRSHSQVLPRSHWFFLAADEWP